MQLDNLTSSKLRHSYNMNTTPTVYRKDTLEGRLLTVGRLSGVGCSSVSEALIASVVIFRILIKTSLQYLILSRRRCWNLAWAASDGGGRKDCARISLRDQRESLESLSMWVTRRPWEERMTFEWS